MSFFTKAERKQAKLRLAIAAVSGAGKTYSALLLAKGLGGKTAVGDSESGSAHLYANLFDYQVAPISAPFTPEKYIEVIREAEKAGFDNLILDSLSHAWSGEGGILDMQGAAEQASKSRNGYFAWREVTPQHNALVNAILQSNMNIIVTMRSKTAYEVSGTKENFKAVKVGLAPIQREGMEYEFTVVLDISVEGHIATSSKDRTGLFDGKHFVINEQTGKDLLGWLNDGTSQDELLKRDYDEFSNLIKHAKSLSELKVFYTNGYKKLAGSEKLQELLVLDKDQKKEEFTVVVPDEPKVKSALNPVIQLDEIKGGYNNESDMGSSLEAA